MIGSLVLLVVCLVNADTKRALLDLDDPRGTLLVVNLAGPSVQVVNADDGSMRDANFITTNLGSPVQALVSFERDRILVSDQAFGTGVLEFSLSGDFVGVFASISFPRGMAFLPNGDMLVCQAGSGSPGIMRLDPSGAGTLFASSLTPLALLLHQGVVYLTESNGDDIRRFELDGTSLAPFATIPGAYQIVHDSSSNTLLVAVFSGPQLGVVELALNATPIGSYSAGATSRGVYPLDNRNLLVGNTANLLVIDRANTVVSTVATSSFFFISSTVEPFPLQKAE